MDFTGFQQDSQPLVVGLNHVLPDPERPDLADHLRRPGLHLLAPGGAELFPDPFQIRHDNLLLLLGLTV